MGRRAMILAMAEMSVQGVGTRKVTAVLQDLSGLEVTSTRVSRADSFGSPPPSSPRSEMTGKPNLPT
jgi:hypothetical protein